MKIAEIRERNVEELRSLRAELKRELWKARFNNLSGQLDDTSQIKKLRRRTARVNTIITEKLQQGTSDKAEAQS